jgi:hypothetical protein
MKERIKNKISYKFQKRRRRRRRKKERMSEI